MSFNEIYGLAPYPQIKKMWSRRRRFYTHKARRQKRRMDYMRRLGKRRYYASVKKKLRALQVLRNAVNAKRRFSMTFSPKPLPWGHELATAVPGDIGLPVPGVIGPNLPGPLLPPGRPYQYFHGVPPPIPPPAPAWLPFDPLIAREAYEARFPPAVRRQRRRAPGRLRIADYFRDAPTTRFTIRPPATIPHPSVTGHYPGPTIPTSAPTRHYHSPVKEVHGVPLEPPPTDDPTGSHPEGFFFSRTIPPPTRSFFSST